MLEGQHRHFVPTLAPFYFQNESHAITKENINWLESFRLFSLGGVCFFYLMLNITFFELNVE